MDVAVPVGPGTGNYPNCKAGQMQVHMQLDTFSKVIYVPLSFTFHL